MSGERSSPYATSSKGKSKGKGCKWNDQRVTDEQIVTHESVFKGKGKGSKGSSTSASSSQGKSNSKGGKGYSRPDFTSVVVCGKGELLRQLWDMAEEESGEDQDFNPELEEPSKNTQARVRNILWKRMARKAQAIQILEQVDQLEQEYVREWQRANNTTTMTPWLGSIWESIPAEFWTLL